MRDNNRPLISVIVPTYNRSHLLKRAIQSLLRQTYQMLEVIVVDDASRDNTEEVVEGFGDKRIVYVKHSVNKGLPASRNTGIRLAKGEYIAFLDDDDEYVPDKLEKQQKKFESSSNKVGMIYCGVSNLYNGKLLYKRMPQHSIKLREALYPISLGWHVVTGLIRKECFSKIGLFDEDLISLEDWDILIRLAIDYEFDFIPEALYIRHIHGAQMITDLKARIKGRELIIRKHINEFLKSPYALSWQYRLLGSLCCMDNNIFEARKYFFKSVKTWPFNFGSYIHILFSFISSSLHKKVIEKVAFKKVGNYSLYY